MGIACTALLIGSTIAIGALGIAQREQLISRGQKITHQSEPQKSEISKGSWENLDALINTEVYLRGVILEQHTVRVGSYKHSSYVTNATIADPNSDRVVIMQFGGSCPKSGSIEGYGLLVRVDGAHILKCDRALVFPLD